MSRENIVYLIKNNKGLVLSVAKRYKKKRYYLKWEEVYSVTLEGFYRAILAYQPSRGDLITYAECYCWGWLKGYYKANRYNDKEVTMPMDMFAFNKGLSIDDRIVVKQIKERLSDDEKEILDCYCYKIPIKDSIKILGLKNRHHYKKKLEKVMKKMKEMV